MNETLSSHPNTGQENSKKHGESAVLLGKTRVLNNAPPSRRSLNATFNMIKKSYLKQSFREQLLMLGLFVAFLVIVYLALRWVPLQNELSAEHKRLDDRLKDLKELNLPAIKGEGANAVQARISKLNDEQAQLMESVTPILKQWVALDNATMLAQQKLAISSLAKQSGLEIIANRPLSTKSDTGEGRTLGAALSNHSSDLVRHLGRLAFKYEMRGTYAALRGFMKGLANLPHKVSFGHFDISVYDPRTESGREHLNITWVLVI